MTTLYREIENWSAAAAITPRFKTMTTAADWCASRTGASARLAVREQLLDRDRKDRLYLGNMWGDRLYVIGRRDRVPELCLACLCQSSTPLTEPSDTICSEFQLVEVPLGDFLCNSPSLAE